MPRLITSINHGAIDEVFEGLFLDTKVTQSSATSATFQSNAFDPVSYWTELQITGQDLKFAKVDGKRTLVSGTLESIDMDRVGGYDVSMSIDDLGLDIAALAAAAAKEASGEDRGAMEAQLYHLDWEITSSLYSFQRRDDRNSFDGVSHNWSGDNIIRLVDGNIRIHAGAGDDIVYSGNKSAQIWGGSGRDQIFGGDGDDELRGQRNADQISGAAGHDRIYGGRGDDVLNGQRGADKLLGRRDDDTLNGGRGDDTLTGGQGNDILKGGLGSDSFVFGAGNRIDKDTITDFNADEDRIVLKTGRDVSVSDTDFGFDIVYGNQVIHVLDTSVADLAGRDGGIFRALPAPEPEPELYPVDTWTGHNFFSLGSVATFSTVSPTYLTIGPLLSYELLEF